MPEVHLSGGVGLASNTFSHQGFLQQWEALHASLEKPGYFHSTAPKAGQAAHSQACRGRLVYSARQKFFAHLPLLAQGEISLT